VTTASGTKFGKTESGAVWLDANLTSPYKFYQFWVNVDDRDVGRYLRYFTLLSREEIEALDQATAEHPERREAQTALARDVATRVHGTNATQIAEEVSGVLFGKKDPRTLSAEVCEALAQEVTSTEASADDTVSDVFVRATLVKSKSEARRLFDQGGAYVSGSNIANERVPANTVLGDVAALAGSYFLIRKGSKDYAVVKLTS
jgi:tyrosyl-tRNA synthetase